MKQVIHKFTKEKATQTKEQKDDRHRTEIFLIYVKIKGKKSPSSLRC